MVPESSWQTQTKSSASPPYPSPLHLGWISPNQRVHSGLRLRSEYALVILFFVTPSLSQSPGWVSTPRTPRMSLHQPGSPMISLSSFPHSLSNNRNVHFGPCYASERASQVVLGLPIQETRRLGFNPSVGKIPWGGHIFLPGESHGERSLASYSPYGHKESDTTEAT